MSSNISNRDKEILTLAVLFFYYKRLVQNECACIYLGKRDGSDEKRVINELSKLPKAGEVVSTFIKNYLDNGVFTFIHFLLNGDIEIFLSSLERIFKNQQMCAVSEGRSYYNHPEFDEFAFATAAEMLLYLKYGDRATRSFRLVWFEEVYYNGDPFGIMRSVVTEMLGVRRISEVLHPDFQST